MSMVNQLYDIKDQLTRIEVMLNTPKEPEPASEPCWKKQATPISIVRIIMLLKTDQKIEAIKELRTITGCGLKEGLTAVESIQRLIKGE